MYHVEVLPNSSSHLTPGWTYVQDRGFDPSKAAITPAIGRKRGIRDPGGRSGADLSSRQTNAIVRHLAELDRENHRDAHIALPVKQKDASGRGTRGKVTPNVRRILQSQKTFRNYLDDEEAALAQAAQTGTGAAQRPSLPHNKITKPSSLRRSSTPISKPESSRSKKQAPQSSRTSTTASTPVPEKQQPQTQDAPDPSTTTPTPAETPQETDKEGEGEADAETDPGAKNTLIKSSHDSDPLLKSYIPSAPSDRIMQALIAEPPLTYNASRAGPPMTTKSRRHFCCMCGYWGKIRCKNCHLRTCGLACYKVHEDSRCGAFF